MKILAIETSCDETAIALLEADRGLDSIGVLGNTVASQADLHARFGGVYPALAKREHAKNIVPVLLDTLKQAGFDINVEQNNLNSFSLEQKNYLKKLFEHEPELYQIFIEHIPTITKNSKSSIDSIAVTTGPGLEPALWVGINFAKALNYVWGVPIIPVNHMEGHILSPLLNLNSSSNKKAQLPALALLISGGHTELVYVPEFGTYEKIGQTLDDAVGEAFDKVARLLGLPYPGGPHIAKLAGIDRSINPRASIDLPKPMINSGDLNFSFSGLKTAVLYMTQKLEEEAPNNTLPDTTKQNIARAFEDSVTEVLIKKVLKALDEIGGQNPIKTILVGGGVSANTFIKQGLINAVQKYDPNISVLFPTPDLSTDNAIMIGMVGILKSPLSPTEGEISANANWEL